MNVIIIHQLHPQLPTFQPDNDQPLGERKIECELKSLKFSITILQNEISEIKIVMESTTSVLKHNKNVQETEQNNRTIEGRFGARYCRLPYKRIL